MGGRQIALCGEVLALLVERLSGVWPHYLPLQAMSPPRRRSPWLWVEDPFGLWAQWRQVREREGRREEEEGGREGAGQGWKWAVVQPDWGQPEVLLPRVAGQRRPRNMGPPRSGWLAGASLGLGVEIERHGF